MTGRDDTQAIYDAWLAEATHRLETLHRQAREELGLPAGLEEDPTPAPVVDEPGYVYTDPVADPEWPGITEFDPDDPPDVFPAHWGEVPTERDQAAIDAGSA